VFRQFKVGRHTLLKGKLQTSYSTFDGIGWHTCACKVTDALLMRQAVLAYPLQQTVLTNCLASASASKCPLPYAGSSGGARGSLGAKKTYAGGATDLLAAIQRRVVLSDQQGDQPGSSNTVSELVLYDPEEHKLQWLAQQEAADAAPQVEPAPPTAPSEPTTAITAPATAASATSATAAAAANQVNMAWEKRVKVYADPFLVEKLRPHQREGVK
jgi:hypothetical protein